MRLRLLPATQHVAVVQHICRIFRLTWTYDNVRNGGMSTVLKSETYVSTQEAAERLGLTDGRIRQMLLADEIKAQKFGQRTWAIPLSEVERLKKQRAAPAA